jgi:hypothetical protein
MNAEYRSGSLDSYFTNCRDVDFGIFIFCARHVGGCCIGVDPTTRRRKLNTVHISTHRCRPLEILAQMSNADGGGILTLIDL